MGSVGSFLRFALCASFIACSFPEIDFDLDGGASATGGNGAGGSQNVGAGTSDGGAGASHGGGGQGGVNTTISSITTDGGGGGDGGSGGGGPVVICKDQDGDGFLSEDSSPECEELLGIEEGTDRDCDDDDDDAFPGQEDFFSRERNSGGWDYDCNETVETEYGLACSAECAWIVVSAGEDGCGDTGPLKRCNPVLLGCVLPVDAGEETQGCR